MRTITIALMLVVAQITDAQTNRPITGAFGLKLGDTLNVLTSAIPFTKITNGVYTFTPTNDFRHFDTFSVLVTKQNEIVMIFASRTFETGADEECQKEAQIIVQLFTDKYGQPYKGSAVEQLQLGMNAVEYREHTRRITITADCPKIEIVYGDEELAEKALKEAEKARLEDAKKKTTSDY